MSDVSKVLKIALERGVITSEQLQAIIAIERDHHPLAWSLSHILYYLGGIVAVMSMWMFLDFANSSFGAFGIIGVSVGYALAALGFTESLVHHGRDVAASITSTFLCLLTPVFLYGLLELTEFEYDSMRIEIIGLNVNLYSLVMHIGVMVVGVALLCRYRYPLNYFPIAVSGWWMVIELGSLQSSYESMVNVTAMSSCLFGVLLLPIAFIVADRNTRQSDQAFWLYLIAIAAIWLGMTAWINLWSVHSYEILKSSLYLLVNVMMIVSGVVIGRRPFIILGGLGVCLFVTHLGYEFFYNTWLFPVVITSAGLGLIYVGVLLQKHRTSLASKLDDLLPPALVSAMQRQRW